MTYIILDMMNYLFLYSTKFLDKNVWLSGLQTIASIVGLVNPNALTGQFMKEEQAG